MGEPVARSPVAEQDRGGRARARSRRWRASSRASTSCRVPPHCSSHGNSRGSGCPPPGPLRPRPIRRASCPARSTPHPSSRVSIHLCFRSRQAPVLAWRLPAVGERGPQIERGGRGIFGKRRRRMPSPAADPGSPMAECRHPAPAWSSHRSSLRSTRPPRHPGRFRVAGCGGAYGGPFGRWPRMSGVACAFPRQGSPARRPATGAPPERETAHEPVARPRCARTPRSAPDSSRTNASPGRTRPSTSGATEGFWTRVRAVHRGGDETRSISYEDSPNRVQRRVGAGFPHRFRPSRCGS